MVHQAFKSVAYLILSVFVLYFLGGIYVRIIDLIDDGHITKMFLIGLYWVSILCIIGLPQYFAWFTNEDISLIAPIKSMVAFAVSFMAIVVVTLVTDKVIASFIRSGLSTTSQMIFSICYWLFAILVYYVPQVFIFEPLKEIHGVKE